ncbi:MAG: 30S ribosomal protein S3, partial [Oxalobacteraceae bacterium]
GPRRDDGKPAGRPRPKRVDGQVAAAPPSSAAKRVHTKKPDVLADSAVAVSVEKAGE